MVLCVLLDFIYFGISARLCLPFLTGNPLLYVIKFRRTKAPNVAILPDQICVTLKDFRASLLRGITNVYATNIRPIWLVSEYCERESFTGVN